MCGGLVAPSFLEVKVSILFSSNFLTAPQVRLRIRASILADITVSTEPLTSKSQSTSLIFTSNSQYRYHTDYFAMALDTEIAKLSVTDDKEVAKCYFTTIPRELRDKIYGYAFESVANPDIRFDLVFHTKGEVDHVKNAGYLKNLSPSKPLLMTCKQVFKEAKPIFDEAYRRDYWTVTPFYIGVRDFTGTDKLLEMINKLKEEEVGMVTKVMLRADGEAIEWQNGVWKSTIFVTVAQVMFFGNMRTKTGPSYVWVPPDRDENEIKPLVLLPLFGSADTSKDGEVAKVIDVTDMSTRKAEAVVKKIGGGRMTKLELMALARYMRRGCAA